MSKNTARNDVTGDWLQSKPNNEMFEKNFDAIFRKKKEELPIDKEWDQMKPVGKEVLPEYELNKSTGEVQKVCKCGVKGCE
jgi:stress response protein YsnF